MVGFYLFLILTKQIAIKSEEYLRDALIIENTGTTRTFNMKFDCPISEGSIKINLVCPDGKCNQVASDQKFWFKANFGNNQLLGRDVEDIKIHNNVKVDAFVPSNTVTYDSTTYTLSYRVDSGNVYYSGYEESTLKCPAPSPTPRPTEVNHDAVVIENTGTTRTFNMKFDCPISEGSIKINLICPNNKCNKVASDRKFWFRVNFGNNQLLGRDVEDIEIHNNVKVDAFVPSNTITYDSTTYTLSYRVDSGNVYYSGYEESTLKCPGPKATPSPEPTPVSYDALVLENEGTTRNFKMKFDCPVSDGSIKINLVCPGNKCNEIGSDQKVWFKANFANGSFIGRDVQNISIHNGIKMDRFVPSNTVTYDPLTYTLSYFVDSGNMNYAGYKDSTLRCPGLPEIITYNMNNMSSDGRYSINDDEKQRVFVNMMLVNFSGISSTVNGGAVYITNAAYQCNECNFMNCESNEAGGAIYLSYTYDIENTFTLNNIEFNGNEAKYGGAVYIYSHSVKNRVIVHYCKFISNTATGTANNEKLFGGSSLYLTARTMSILNNYFNLNKGEGSDVRIVNNFNKNLNSISSKIRRLSNEAVVIENCQFNINNKLDSSLFFIRGNYGPKFELRRCTFMGDLKDGAHFIDGQSISDNSPKLIVKKCRFAADVKRALNLDKSNEFLSVDLNGQVFDFNGKDEKINGWKIIVAAVVPAVVVVVVIVAVVIVLKRKSKNVDKDENEKSTEIHENLIDGSLL